MPPGGQENLDAHIEHKLVGMLGAQNYQRRLKGKARFQVEGHQLVVHVGNPLVLQWLQSRHSLLLNEIAGEVVGPDSEVVFRAAESIAPESADIASGEQPSSDSKVAAVYHSTESVSPIAPATRKRHSDFFDFVVGEGNQLAFTAARQVAERPGAVLNPLVLHGGVGIGKSHLLEAIVKGIRTRFPALQSLMVTAENFLNYFTEAMKSHSLPSFRQRFRKVDVLLVDDIEFLSSKPASREEFLNTIKKLSDEGCQMVFTADRHPRLLEGMGDDLISRLMGGMVCRIEPPDLATRKALVTQFTQRASFSLSEEIQNYIAERFHRNARELQGAVNSLYALALVSARHIEPACRPQSAGKV